MAACVALAMGAHAALLLHQTPGTERPAHPAGAALSVRLQQAEAPTVAAALPETEVTEAPPLPQGPATTAAATTTGSSDEAAPSFEGGPPCIDFPDAPLPAGGAEVRAHLVLDDQGMARTVITAATPGVPLGFQKVTELGLKQARLHAPQGTGYCLLVRFDPEAAAAKLAWLPGAAQDAARCLAGALPAPREIAPNPSP